VGESASADDLKRIHNIAQQSRVDAIDSFLLNKKGLEDMYIV
jgi:hypothetical protein